MFEAIAELPRTHLLKRLYDLKKPNETDEQWMQRLHLNEDDFADAARFGAAWDLDSRNMDLVLDHAGLATAEERQRIIWG